MSNKAHFDFEARRNLRKKRAQALKNELESLKGKLKPGLTLTNKNKDCWAIILPDVSMPGKFRYQIFDVKGFISHHTEESIEKALEGAFSCGYRILDDNALDRVSLTSEWSRGMAIQAIRDQYNYGKIGWDELFQKIKQVDNQYKEAV